MDRVLVVGSNGLLGQSLVNRLVKLNYEVFTLARGENRNSNATNYTDLDITNQTALLKYITEIKPQFIINAAAVTNVDYCESHQQECDAVNVEAVNTLIKGAELNQAHIIHISTDFVFDGLKGNYNENDATNPLNYYGLSKLKSEALFKNAKIPFTILRTILVFGYQPNLKQQNILLWLLDKMKQKIHLTMVDDQWRTPTYVEDLATACILAMQTKSKGLYHISGEGLINMYQLSNIVAESFNHDTSLITAIPTSQLSQPAERPKITGFDISKAKHDFDFVPTSFLKALLQVKNKMNL